METTRFTGRGELIPRLIEQVGNKAFAMKLLQDRGDMNLNGTLTFKGQQRNNMTAGERALTRDDASAITHDYNLLKNNTTQNT